MYQAIYQDHTSVIQLFSIIFSSFSLPLFNMIQIPGNYLTDGFILFCFRAKAVLKPLEIGHYI